MKNAMDQLMIDLDEELSVLLSSLQQGSSSLNNYLDFEESVKARIVAILREQVMRGFFDEEPEPDSCIMFMHEDGSFIN